MPLTTLNVSQVIDKTLIADANVDYFNTINPIGTKAGTFKKGDVIGKIYSYAYGNTNNLYWSIYRGNNLIFVKHDANKLQLAEGRAILTDIKNQQEQAAINEKGLLRFYIDKYAPYLIGAAVIYIALPTIFKIVKNEK